MIRIEKNNLTVLDFLRLYRSVGWEPPGQEQVERALDKSLATFQALADKQVVGMVRLLGDEGISFYIKDFAVCPDYQGRGIGRMLMQAIEEEVRTYLSENWAVSLELIASKEAAGFYQQFDFSEGNDPGMMKMIRK